MSAAKRLPTWAAACLLVAAAADCPTPSTNTYTMEPPAATYPARPLRELTTPVTAVLRWHGNDEAQLAACLGTLRATLPRARVTIAARDMERARRVGRLAGGGERSAEAKVRLREVGKEQNHLLRVAHRLGVIPCYESQEKQAANRGR